MLDFTVHIEEYTLQEYMDEADMTLEDVKYCWGCVYDHYIWARMDSKNYCQRLFAPITRKGREHAIQQVMKELWKDFNA